MEPSMSTQHCGSGIASVSLQQPRSADASVSSQQPRSADASVSAPQPRSVNASMSTQQIRSANASAEAGLSPETVCHLRWLATSLVEFPSEELEAQYAAHQEMDHVSIWTIGSAVTNCIGWPLLCLKMYGQSREVRALAPPLLLPALLHLLPSLAVVALLLLAPHLYAAHRRRVNAAVHVIFIVNFHFMREAVLFMKLFSKSRGIAAFLPENLYLAMYWQIVVLFPTGEGTDLLLATACLIANLAGNARICASPLLGRNPVTLAPGLLKAAQALSDWTLMWSYPYISPSGWNLQTCTSVLAFWQVQAWLLAWVVILVTHMKRREAFLRSPAARAVLVRGGTARPGHWPWEGQEGAGRVLPALLLMYLTQAIVWGVVLELTS